MASKKTDWKAKYESLAAENRKLAKRANQRLVRLERAAKKKGMQSITQFAYRSAMKDIKSLGKKGKQRFTESPRLVSINDGSKELTGAALYKANYYRQLAENKMIRSFLGAASSTLGEARSGEKEGIARSKGIKAIWDKRNQTINEKYLSEYDLQMSDNDFKRFWDSRKQKKLEAIVGSDQMFVVASVMKKFNLKSSRKEIEKFAKDHIVLPSGTDETILDMRTKESREEYLKRLSDYIQYTDDDIVNKYVNKALSQGIDVNNIFI